MVIDFAAMVRDPGNTCAATHVQIDPGPYTLRYECEAVTLDQTLFACAGWQTQLFISEAPEDARIALDLPGLSLLMARPGEGFVPDAASSQAAELARKALRRGQPAITGDQLSLVLDEKLENPMLAIFAAHLLLLRGRREDKVATVLQHAERMAPQHPDVACLRLALDPAGSVVVTAPPMLVRSWDVLVETSTREMVAIETSALERISDGLWDTGGPWLTWDHAQERRRRTRVSAPRAIAGEAASGLPDLRRNTAYQILQAIADESMVGISVADARQQLRGTREPIGTTLAKELDLSETEAAFINAVTLDYSRRGPDALGRKELASRLRMPTPLVRMEAKRLADLLRP